MLRSALSAAGASLAIGLLAGCAGGPFRDAGPAPAVAPTALATWPHREVWTGIVFNGEKVGFTRREVRPAAGAPGRYEIESEAVIRLRFLGFDKRLNLRSVDRVRGDLTLESFRYSNEIDGSPLQVEGRVEQKTLRFTVKASGSTQEKTLSLQEALYPSSALGLLPVVRGLAVGANARYSVFHGETQAIAPAEQEVQAYEASDLFPGTAFRTLTRMQGLETMTWYTAAGLPLIERGMQGVMISALEDEASARRYLLEASLARRDALVEFSLLRAGPIEAARRVSRMDIVIDELPAGFAAPSGGGQACTRAGSRLTCRIDRAAPLGQDDPKRYLAATLAAPNNLGQIRDLARKIASGEQDRDKVISRLLSWIDANIAKEAVDSFTAIDVLRERRAECQGHAYLLAALSRALGIPARVVNGLAYSEAHGGFLYHTWNELWVEGRGWQPVDATFSQAHADATHVKLVEGESPAELVPLAALIGRIRVASVAALARW
jgi:hypothetical protein